MPEEGRKSKMRMFVETNRKQASIKGVIDSLKALIST